MWGPALATGFLNLKLWEGAAGGASGIGEDVS